MKQFFHPRHILLAALATLFLLIALWSSRSRAPQGISVEVIGGLDTSASERVTDANGATALGRNIALFAKLAGRLDQHRDHLSVFRVDREAQEFYDQLAPRSRERFQWLLIRETKAPASQSRTLPYTFWEAAAKRAARTTSPVFVCLGSNGDCDDLSLQAHTRLRRAAQQLAHNPRVEGVWIFGAQAKNWAAIRQDFAALGHRLHLQNPEELDVGPLLAELESARLPKSRFQSNISH